MVCFGKDMHMRAVQCKELPEDVTIFTLCAERQFTEQKSSVFPTLFVLSIISADDLSDLQSAQGVIFADFCRRKGKTDPSLEQ